MTDINIRPLLDHEHAFLREMLYLAIYVPKDASPPPLSILNQPSLSKYIEKWGRVYDLALVADDNGTLAGAVWCRLYGAAERGYGYIDDQTPELSIAIKENFRNRGLGTALMTKLFDLLREKGCQQVSLSVDQKNKALHLYLRLGFETITSEGTAFTMKKVL